MIIDPSGGEVCKGRGERDFPTDGESGCDAHHVGFSDTALNESLRKISNESVQLQGASQVCGEGDDVGVSFPEFVNAVTKSTSCIFLSGRLNILQHFLVY